MLAVALLGVALLPAGQRIAENRHARAVMCVFGPALKCRTSPHPPWIARLLPGFLSRDLWPRVVDDAAAINSNGRPRQFSDNDLKEIYIFRHLEELSVTDCPITDRGLAYVVRLRELKTLGLAGTKVTDEGLRAIAGMQSIEMLVLSRTAVTDDGLRYIANMPNLRSLSLRRTGITDRAATILGSMPALKGLVVTDTGLTVAGAAALRKLMPHASISADVLKGTGVE
jgi:hypothetical protein